MYYNSSKNSNDYYNSYKKEIAELHAYKKEENIQKILKVFFSILAFILLLVGAFYLYKYFNPTLTKDHNNVQKEKVFTTNKSLQKIVIREEELPQSIQLQESTMHINENIHMNATDTKEVVSLEKETEKLIAGMSKQDIALIVKVIMSQMNTQKEIPLEEQLEQVAHKKFETKSLKNTNHYNKVVLTTNQAVKVENSSLVELSNNLSRIVNESTNSNSSYSEAIKKEVIFRKNAMRIIIVQKGDTLSRISKKAYGNYDDYPKIFSANPEIIKNPNQIFVGQRLRIPS